MIDQLAAPAAVKVISRAVVVMALCATSQYSQVENLVNRNDSQKHFEECLTNDTDVVKKIWKALYQ